jgi:hypothetical protein
VTVGDGLIIGVISILGTVVATVAGALAYMTKRHLTALDKTVKTQTGHIVECDEDRTKIKASHERLKLRTDSLERALRVTVECPNGDCPNRQLMKVTTAQTIRPSDS